MWLNQVGSNDQFRVETFDPFFVDVRLFMTGRSPGGLKMDFSSNLSKCQISKRQKFKIDLDFLLEPKFKVSNFRTISKFRSEKKFERRSHFAASRKLMRHLN